jgi:hypothetical protein
MILLAYSDVYMPSIAVGPKPLSPKALSITCIMHSTFSSSHFRPTTFITHKVRQDSHSRQSRSHLYANGKTGHLVDQIHLLASTRHDWRVRSCGRPVPVRKCVQSRINSGDGNYTHWRVRNVILDGRVPKRSQITTHAKTIGQCTCRKSGHMSSLMWYAW